MNPNTIKPVPPGSGKRLREAAESESLLIALADDELPLLYREEGVELLKQSATNTFGYEAQINVDGNQKAIAQIYSAHPDDPGHLAQHRAGLGEVMQHVHHGDAAELSVRVRKLRS